MKTRPLCFVCLLILLIQSVFLVITSRESYVKIPASSIFREAGKQVTVQGQVYKKSKTSNNQVLYLKNKSLEDSKIMIYLDNQIEIPIGKEVQVRGITMPFENARNPGNYDPALYYAKQGIFGAVYGQEVLSIQGNTHRLREQLYQCKTAWKGRLVDALGEKHGNTLAAMLVGEKSEMDADVKELYQKNGIGHILAISGLHISFIGLGIYQLIRRLGLGYLPSGILAIGILSLYVLMLGFSVSVMRAYIMLLIRIGADITGRVYDMLTALLLSATLTVVYQPLYFLDAGFYLSYGAILGILFILPVWNRFTHGKGKWVSGLLTSLSVNLMLLPILLWFYFEIPPYSVFLNVIVIPLMSVLLGCGMVGSGLLWCVPTLGEWCLTVCGWVLDFYEWCSQMLSELPGCRLVLGKPELWEVLFYYVMLGAFLVILHFYKRRKKVWTKIMMGCVYIFAACLVVCGTPTDLEVTMLDVGQGDSIFVKTPEGTTCLIDGGSSDVEQVGKRRIEPFLLSQGVAHLDYVFVSHGDADHCNGIRELLERQDMGVTIEYLIFPANFQRDEALLELAKIAQGHRTKVLCIHAGESIAGQDWSFTCLQPEQRQDLTGNAGSMVLELQCGACSVLFTGDVEGLGEEALTQKLKGKSYDVLKVAHHGSKESTTEEFLQSAHPKLALISAGTGNSYGHPHKETLDRLTESGCQIYETAKMGAITLKTDGNSLTISRVPFRL